jgi:hypothetical protein
MDNAHIIFILQHVGKTPTSTQYVAMANKSANAYHVTMEWDMILFIIPLAKCPFLNSTK